MHTPGSFTKNFSWDHSYERLFISIRKGFCNRLDPTSRDKWREASGIRDRDRQLIPLNFFLYNAPANPEDLVLVDRLVDAAIERPYNVDFAQLALFAFHLAQSGTWRHTRWPNGQVAGWANELVRESWTEGRWSAGAFTEAALTEYFESALDAEAVTRRKVFTNYRFMLRSAGVLKGDELQAPNYAQRWYIDAVELFWDRQYFEGNVIRGASSRVLEEVFFDHEAYKLLNCDEAQAKVFTRVAAREYLPTILAARHDQIEILRTRGVLAA
ncbi:MULTISPECIES: hypothetical protein [unclassified Bradyrhizobium]|uniref:hypothetical protein n=1 Tax=unclassified Bradyrhizobium TaxID=2631580 RepID=UPI0028E678DC|nr:MULTISPECIES: hypothetical protein [unclassified Bradyrhizobium]